MENVISKNDKNVLQMILNPNLPLDDDEEEGITNGHLDPDSAYDQATLAKVKELEKEGVKMAEAKEFVESLKCFDQAIELLPNRASGYNNRAQLKRLAGNVDGALEDLDKAISLSGDNKKVAGLAYTQRAVIMKLKGDEENSKKDFTKAAELGNRFAKHELVQSNPYAALCNQMLSQVFQDLQKGVSTPSDGNPQSKRAKH